MASTIQIKNSSTSGNSPSSLTQGELAINVADGNLFYGDGSSVLQRFAITELTASSNVDIQGTLSLPGFNDVSASLASAVAGGGISNIVEDTTPQLGGNLDTNGKNISFGDAAVAGTDDTLTFGAGNDLLIYHDGSDSFIKDNGTGDLRIQASSTRIEDYDGSPTHIQVSNSQLTLNAGSGIINVGTNKIGNVADEEYIQFSTTDIDFHVNDTRRLRVGDGFVAVNGNFNTTGSADINGTLSLPGFNDVSASLAAAVAGGDDLGNHTATQNLNMGGFAITSVGNVDGVDVSTLKSDFDTLEGKTLVSGSSQIDLGSATGTATNASTASYIAGSNVDGTVTLSSLATTAINATNAANIDVNNVSGNSEYGLVFRDGNGDGNQALYADNETDQPSYNPSTNTITTPIISASSALYVGGDITITGNVDGVDVSTLKSDFDTLEGKTLVSGSSQITIGSTTGTITSAKISDVDAFSQSGTYASLRAQGTTAADVGLGNVENTALSTYTGNGGALDNQYITNGAGYTTNTGTVDTSGTPADNQIAVFTDANTIEGTSKLTFSNSEFFVESTNNTGTGVKVYGGVQGSTQPYISPVGANSRMNFGDGSSGHIFDFLNNKIAFDSDSTNTYIQADTDTPENLEIHADGNIELRADDELQVFSNTDIQGTLSITGITDVSASIAAAGGGGGGISNVVEDTTPQLGGDLDTNGNNIGFGDNDSASFGNSNDLKIYHDGSDSFIKDNGTGDLRIQASSTRIEDYDGSPTHIQVSNSQLTLNAGSGIINVGTNKIGNIADEEYIQFSTTDIDFHVSDTRVLRIGDGSVDIDGTLSLPGISDVSASIAAAGGGGGGAVATYTNGSNDRILTSTGTDSINGESGLTFNGTTLRVAGNQVFDPAAATRGIVTDIENNWESTSLVSSGEYLEVGASTTRTAHRLYNLSGSWAAADNGAVSTATGLLGISVDGNSGNDWLIRGTFNIPNAALNGHPAEIGSPIYIGGTAGEFSATPPTTSGEVSRIIGHIADTYVSGRVTYYKIYFNPSPEWIEL